MKTLYLREKADIVGVEFNLLEQISEAISSYADIDLFEYLSGYGYEITDDIVETCEFAKKGKTLAVATDISEELKAFKVSKSKADYVLYIDTDACADEII